MATHNDITGDALVSKRSNDNYLSNYDRIFRKKENTDAGTGPNGAVVQITGVSGTGCAGPTCGAGGDDTSRSPE